jgi:hypothetical protein
MLVKTSLISLLGTRRKPSDFQGTNEKFKQKYGYAMNAEAVKAYVGMYVIADTWKELVH